ncbi:DUF2797 domain-containing protein [Empedobacter sp. UBA5987]|uniref:DUF2797 domain-containing protein n=1 Tax=Empedobacter sp. UBA5987 TaxID=1946444 RepID=UPI0025BBE389|nr:DUF2797 domain-containing protein [Empedobacter sp. UBA5987]
MQFEGQIRKMTTENGTPINYYWNFKNDFIVMNQLLGKKIKINFDHYECLNCHEDKEIYQMGYCKDCFFTIPEANPSIINPELSTAHLGIAQRDLEFETKFELQPHIVYLANSSGIKVGVTRLTQVPTRWIDQGASEAIIIARTDNRYEAGMIEVSLKNVIADKTNWQRMLKNDVPEINLFEKYHEIRNEVNPDFQQFLVDEPEVWKLDYPVLSYPEKVKSLNLKKTPEIKGVLKGIKGQYLIFEDNTVFNVRGHEGFYVNFEV